MRFGDRSSTLLACLLLAGFQPCLAADTGKIRQLIQSADILPQVYRDHININAVSSDVAVGVYRDPDEQAYDCKIDAILITSKVLEAAPATKRVFVAFYDLSDADKFWQVEVPASAVQSYVRHEIAREDVVKAANLTVEQTNNLAKKYGSVSYKSLVNEIGVVPGALREKRAVAAVRIDGLEHKGVYVGELRRRFMHLEDLVRRGETNSATNELQVLTKEIDELAPNGKETVHRLESLAGVQDTTGK